MLKQLEHVATLPTIRLGMRLYLLTMVRKSELQDAEWDEIEAGRIVLEGPGSDLASNEAVISAYLGGVAA